MIVKMLTSVAFLVPLSIVSCLSFAQELAQTEGAVLSSTRNTQANWRWCYKCDGLHYIGGGLGPCPAGGTHSTSGSGAYALAIGGTGPSHDTGPGYAYYWCHKCQGLFTQIGAGPDYGVCPAGGSHDRSGSGEYLVFGRYRAEMGQESWRKCSKCGGLFYAGSAPHGKCPEDGEHKAYAGYACELLKESKLPILWGDVFNSSSQPVSDAVLEVRTQSGSSRSTRTKGDGTWCTANVTTGKLYVRATKGNLSTGWKSISVRTGDVLFVADLLLK